MTTRKNFIGASALLAATLPQHALANTPPSSPTQVPDLQFDLAAFDALLERKVAHKHLFSARKIESGSVFDGVKNTLAAYRSIAQSVNSVLPVTVFYHGISPLMAFDDAVWEKYVPAALTISSGKSWNDDLKDAAGVGKTNPYKSSIDSLARDANLHLFVCNNAVLGMSNILAAPTSQGQATVYNDLVGHLLPNATLVPAGVWAIHAIQQRGFTLLQTS